MELFAQFLGVYLLGWCMGFLTLALLALIEGRKQFAKIKSSNHTNVRDLYPPKDNN